jgi:TM2 domain-containing membrane protein YozV
MLIEQRVSNEAKSTGAAYLLWFFLGGIGGHRFYLGRIKTALLMLIISILGWLTIFAYGLGLFLLVPLGIWVLLDAFLIPGMIQRHKDNIRAELTNQALQLSNG